MPITVSPKEKAKMATKKLLNTAHQREVKLATSLPPYNEQMKELVSGEIENKGIDSPLMEQFYLLEGQQGLLTLTNFTSQEIDELWNTIEDHVQAHWNIGRGYKHPQKPKDVFLMALSVLKQGEPWDIVAQSYKMMTAVFEKLVSGFIKVITDHLYNSLVSSVAEKWPMERLKTEGKHFENHPHCYYAVDIHFHQTY